MKLFGTAGVRGSVRDRVTPELALAVGRAVGVDGETFVLGRDGRETGPALSDALAAGLQSVGADVHRVGVVPTPTLAFASRGRHGVMVTASHNPPADNGIKVFADGKEYDRAAERRVEERVASGVRSPEWVDWGNRREEATLHRYRAAVIRYAERYGTTPSGLQIAIDCGNGTGGLATPQVVSRLGANVVALNANVDGHFLSRESKPTPESLASFRSFVAGGRFDLGIAHDGDADRIVVLGSDGRIIHEDTILAILAEHYVRSTEVSDPVVVTTPNASARIDERVEAAGGRVERVRLGALHEGIAAAESAGGDVVFAAEPWKHVHPKFGGWIDGVASAAVLVRLVAKTGDVETLRESVTERPYRKEAVDCPDEAKADAMTRLERTLPDAFPEATVDTSYGVRLERADGSWTLVRPSGTEPYLRIYAEADDVDGLIEGVTEVVESAIETGT